MKYFRSNYRIVLTVLIILSLSLSGCSSNSTATADAPSGPSAPLLDSAATNLVFVVTPDLSNNNGDININTANLTNQGLQRAIKLGTWLHTSLLNSANVRGIYALEPATRLQTANNYPDLVPLEIIEQFALLNQYTENVPQPVTGDSFPVGVSYSPDSVPQNAVAPLSFPSSCQGIDFADKNGDNETLVNGIIAQKQSGYYVFAIPFDTFKSLLNNLKSINSYSYAVPDAAEGPNILYVLAVQPAGQAALTKFDTHISPGTTYPELNPPWQYSPSNYQTPFVIQTSNVSGSLPPAGINRNETVYFIRHGEAHPTSNWDDGNLIIPGIWRGLYLPTALAGRIKTPDFVYAPDPAQLIAFPWTSTYSYVRPSQTVAPYAIANGIPFNVASGFLYTVSGITPESQAQVTLQAANFFFVGGQFTNKTLLVAWEHNHIPLIAQSLVNLYFANTSNAPAVPSYNTWPGDDYDTIWTFTLDDRGNLTISNLTCEGINSATLPTTSPSLSLMNSIMPYEY